MIGRKVRVFWPLDEQWYVGIVQKYDQATGEHLLCYPDGDTEWVKIGENGPTPGGGGAVSPGQRSTRIRGGNMGGHSSESLDGPHHQGMSHPAHHPGMQQMHGRKGEGSPEEHNPRNLSPHGDQMGPPPGQGSSKGGANSGAGGGSYQGMSPYNPHHMGYGPPPGMPPHFGSPYGQGGHYPPGPYGYPPPPMHMMGGSPGQGEKRNGKGQERDQTSSSSQTPTSGTKRKSGPKTWTKEEDAMLLGMVQSMRMPMKWSIVAQSMPDRTGKQCRERYVNHLNPRLKSTDWSPSEDATIFHLYNTSGSQWAKMSKMIPGRTDNGIKNRFHNLRRQLEREDEHRVRLSNPQDFPDEIRLERLRKFPRNLRGKSDELWEMSDGIGVLAAQSVLGGSFARNAGRFGPFKEADATGEQCARCGLFAPSVHCGYEICTRSKWCQSCTRIPPHMSSNLLRECLNLRRCHDSDKLKIVESWNDESKNSDGMAQ